jgi:hypothetical protein
MRIAMPFILGASASGKPIRRLHQGSVFEMGIIDERQLFESFRKSDQMTEANPKLHAALEIAARIPPRQFAQILRRMAIALRTRDSIPFTDEEVEALIQDFQLTSAEFDELFSASLYVLQQSACFAFDAGRVEEFATGCGASEAVAGCFSAVWDAEGFELGEALKQRTISDYALDVTDWRLHMKAAANGAAPSRDPLVFMDLNVPGEKPITIQFTHKKLGEFFQTIETIQQAIDKLS